MDNVILGKGCTYSTDCSLTGLNNNAIVFGPSGSGKTMSITEPCLLETNDRSLVCAVTKRRIINKYKNLLEKRGYEVLDLDFVHPQKGNVGYDPLQHIHSYQDITFLAEAIVMANPRKEKSTADPFWDQDSVSLLCAIIALVLMTEEDPTFNDVLSLYDTLEFHEEGSQVVTSLDSKFKQLETVDPTCFAITCWKSFKQLPYRTSGCVYGTLNTTIDTIFNPDIRKMMKMEKQVDFKRLGHEKSVLFVTTSPVNPALHAYINTFYANLFKRLFEFAEEQPSGMLPIPVHVIADDFATGSKILNFPEYISIFREKQVSVTLLLQSESQLESMYGYDDSVTIINNCDTIVYLGGMDLKTAQNFSLRLNTPLEDVLYMPLGQEVVLRRGQRPIVTERYNILDNELYQKVTRDYERQIALQSR